MGSPGTCSAAKVWKSLAITAVRLRSCSVRRNCREHCHESATRLSQGMRGSIARATSSSIATTGVPMSKMLFALPAVALLAACGSNDSTTNQNAATSGVQVTGAGSTFVYPALSAWATDYRNQAGTAVNYQSIGSGGGISQVEAGTVDFGATDQPLASDELAKNKLAQFPIVIGGIVPVVNVTGLNAGQLKLSGPVLADIC